MRVLRLWVQECIGTWVSLVIWKMGDPQGLFVAVMWALCVVQTRLDVNEDLRGISWVGREILEEKKKQNKTTKNEFQHELKRSRGTTETYWVSSWVSTPDSLMHALFRESNVNQELEEIEWHTGDVFDNLPNRIKRPSFQAVILYLTFEEYRSASQGCVHTQSCACPWMNIWNI